MAPGQGNRRRPGGPAIACLAERKPTATPAKRVTCHLEYLGPCDRVVEARLLIPSATQPRARTIVRAIARVDRAARSRAWHRSRRTTARGTPPLQPKRASASGPSVEQSSRQRRRWLAPATRLYRSRRPCGRFGATSGVPTAPQDLCSAVCSSASSSASSRLKSSA